MINDAMGYKLTKIAQRWEGKSHVYVDVFGGQEARRWCVKVVGA